MAFNGYLVKTYNNTVLDRYLVEKGYEVTPDQRQDQDSYRDGLGELHRRVLPKVATTLKLTTLDGLTLEQVTAFQTAVESGRLNVQERKVRLTYWNSETRDYCTDIFYMPDMTFKVKRIESGTLIHESMTFTFIGYGATR